MAKEVTVTTGAVYSILAPGTQINGDLYSEADIRLDGAIEGNIICEGKVILGQASSLNGDIKCSNAEISGMVTGRIDAPEMLSLKATSVITGSIRTSTLMIEPGASFNGSCEMVREA
jgi:cytoskeletal protein CcmA (bactofilin family)